MQFGPRTLLFVILLIAMPIASYIFMFKPLRQQRDEAIAETQDKQEKLNALSNVMLKTRDLNAEIEKWRQAIDLLKKRLPDQREMDLVLKEVWQIAERDGLNAKSVRSLKTIDSATYSEQPIKMVLWGPISPGLFKFLSDIELLPRLTRINEMKIEADDKNVGFVTADLVLTVYFESNQKVVGAQ